MNSLFAVREPDAHALKEPVVNGIGVGSCSSAACRTEGFERGLSHREAAFEAQISTEVLRQDQSRSSVHHEGCAGKAALPVPPG